MSGLTGIFHSKSLGRKDGAESDGFIKGFGLVPNPLKPASLPHIHHQVQVVFPPRLADVGGLGKELVPEGIEGVLNLLWFDLASRIPERCLSE